MAHRETTPTAQSDEMCSVDESDRTPTTTVPEKWTYSLNVDVLLLIMSFCDKHTLTRVMCTCPTLRSERAKVLLDGCISICDLRALVSFIFFVKAHRPTILYVHCTSLSAPSIQTSRLLSDLFASHPVVYPLLCKLRSLRHLALHRCGKFPGAPVFRSPIISLTVSYITPESFFDPLDDVEGPRHHPMLLCSSLFDTLETLEIQYSRKYSAVVWQPLFTFSETKRLVLHDNMPYTTPYATAFPNLTHLTISTTHQQKGTDLESGADAVAARDHRTLNRTTQSLAGGTWSRLEHLTGDVAGLYLLSPVCNVGHLIVAPISETHHLYFLFAVLMDTDPTALELTLTIALLAYAWPDFVSDLQPGATPLSSLTLAVSVGPLGVEDSEDFDIDEVMDEFIDGLQDYKLQTLKLHLYPLPHPDLSLFGAPASSPRLGSATGSGSDHLSAETPFSDPPLTSTETSLAAFDPNGFANKLADAFPTLNSAEVRIVRPRSSTEDSVVLTRGEDGHAVFVHSTHY